MASTLVTHNLVWETNVKDIKGLPSTVITIQINTLEMSRIEKSPNLKQLMVLLIVGNTA